MNEYENKFSFFELKLKLFIDSCMTCVNHAYVPLQFAYLVFVFTLSHYNILLCFPRMPLLCSFSGLGYAYSITTFKESLAHPSNI